MGRHRGGGTDWSAARDTRLRRLRAEGAGWPAIGEALGVSADIARERGRRIGAVRPPGLPAAPREDAEDPGREALPAGHPRAWDLLTAGTQFAGTRWPGYGE